MIRINVTKNNETTTINAMRGEKMENVLKRGNISYNMPCGGKGSCGKCKAKVLGGSYPYNERDLMLLGEEKVREGFRLLCQMKAIKDIDIILEEGSGFEIVDNFEEKELKIENREKGYGICVDIGTTTVASQIIDLYNGEILKRASRINSQKNFGSDVISRLEASLNGNGEVLKKEILEDILYCIEEITQGLDKEEIKKIILCGNTAMTYLLIGQDCNEIARYPFRVSLKMPIIKRFSEVFEKDSYDARVYIVDCLSSFIGGDIVSGIVFSNLLENKNKLLIDLGTNAEMAIFNGERLYTTSAAAGPAFEGGSISCGIGGVKGAICSAEIKNGIWSYETIGREKACGICGSGLIDAIATMLDNSVIDKNGLLEEKYFEEGVKIGKSVRIIQKDIREFQLAKAAIRAGMKILLKKAEININDVKEVLVAGGFGFKINIENAFKAGLFFDEFKGKVKPIGNSALGGMRDILLENKGEYIEKIKGLNEGVNLAENEEFNSIFMEEMSF